MARVEEIIANVDKLPALPHAATRVVEMLTDGHSDLGEIEEVSKSERR